MQEAITEGTVATRTYILPSEGSDAQFPGHSWGFLLRWSPALFPQIFF